jgi:hypothetical protein
MLKIRFLSHNADVHVSFQPTLISVIITLKKNATNYIFICHSQSTF